MSAEQITITVDPQAASAYRAASASDRRKLDVLLALHLHEVTQPARSLDEVIRDVSRRAHERGLTDQALRSILNGE